MVSAIASLQNSVPVQAMAPRQNGETSTCRPMRLSAWTRSVVRAFGHVREDDVLHDGGAQAAVAILVCEVGQLDQLVAGQPTAKDACANRGQTWLALPCDAHVIAIDVVRHYIGIEWVGIELVAELLLDGGEHRLRCPAMLHEQVLDAGMRAAFAQHGLLAEDPEHGLDDVIRLILRDEGRDPNGHMGLVGEAAADAQGVADLLRRRFDRRERDVVDLRIGAPLRAAA